MPAVSVGMVTSLLYDAGAIGVAALSGSPGEYRKLPLWFHVMGTVGGAVAVGSGVALAAANVHHPDPAPMFGVGAAAVVVGLPAVFFGGWALLSDRTAPPVGSVVTCSPDARCRLALPAIGLAGRRRGVTLPMLSADF